MNNWTIQQIGFNLYKLTVLNSGEEPDTIWLDRDQIDSLKKFLETVEL
jgi:hypothetical protein